MRIRRILVPLLAVPALVLTSAASSQFPASIPLPDDFGAEGVAVGTGTTFYAGSLYDGDIYRGDLRTGAGSLLVDDAPAPAVGLKADERRHLLVVAGGGTGKGIVYDTRDGSTIAVPQLGLPPNADGPRSLINDVVVTGDAAYFTDSFAPKIYRLPIGPTGAIGTPTTIDVAGDAEPIVGPLFIGLNGIDAAPDGTLIVGNTSLAGVFTVDPDTGASEAIDLGGPLPDANDGILLEGNVLWIVANFSNQVLKVKLASDLSSGTIADTVTSDLFQVPTTVAVQGNRLVLVNGRFDLGFPPPFGPGAPEGTTFNAVQVDKP